MMDKNTDGSGGFRLYIIGDIHGRSDLLERMINQIYRDLVEHGAENCLFITLGDYIDRGPDSRGVIERLAHNPFPSRYIALKGNHEELLQEFLNNAQFGDQWRSLGGLETLHSYGVPVKKLMRGKGFDEAAAALKAAIPKKHRAFLSALKPALTIGHYFLCHAGVRPGVPLGSQKVDDLLWIRDEFLNSTFDFGRIIIHGHSPTEWPEIRSNRINIDTGAFATGRLTCLVLDGEQYRFLFTA